MKLRNETERNVFLNDYSLGQNGWYLWKSDDDLQRRWWRRDFDDCSMVVEDNLRTHTWPTTKVKYEVLHWYIITDWKIPFADGAASLTQIRNKLKELTMNGKEI